MFVYAHDNIVLEVDADILINNGVGNILVTVH